MVLMVFVAVIDCVAPVEVVIFFVALVLWHLHLSIGVYGDVMRVKILFNKKENALIQMSDGTQAQLGSYSLALQKHYLLSLIYNFSLPLVLPHNSLPHIVLRFVWFLVVCDFILWTLLSHEPPEWPASSWQGHACGFFKTHHGAVAQRRPWGPGPHKGLQQLTTASFQEAWLQELLQYLPTLCNTPPLQHTVSAAARAFFFFHSHFSHLCCKDFPLLFSGFLTYFFSIFVAWNWTVFSKCANLEVFRFVDAVMVSFYHNSKSKNANK